MHIDSSPSAGLPIDIQAYRNEGDEKNVAFWKIVAESNDNCVIYYMTVRKKYKGQGYGTAILDGLKKAFREIKTEIGASTEESIKWLKSKGFQAENGWLVWKTPKIDVSH